MSTGDITVTELQLAARNHGMPLEALRYAVTPVGLHYLLTHYDIPFVDTATWRLTIDGEVERPLELSLDDLRARPATVVTATMECAGNGRARLEPRPMSQPWLSEAVGTATWRGVELGSLLAEAGLRAGAVEVVFTGLDAGIEGGEHQRFARSLPVEESVREGVVLAYEVNEQPLPPQHGFPLRLVVPGWYGMTNVKWLASVTASDRPFEGYQQRHAYRLRQTDDEPGDPLTRMAPRALMIPPGTPHFPSRDRTLELGPCVVTGRAWSGWGAVEAVDFSADGGKTWAAADLDRPIDAWAWRGWQYLWEPPAPGVHELACRARDSAGNEQPLHATWNAGGYANNAVQRVPVTVVA